MGIQDVHNSVQDPFEHMFEQDVMGMALRAVDPHDARWLRVNQKFCDMLGYTREELLQLTSVEITTPDGRHESIKYSENLLRGDFKSYSREKRFLRKDGSVIWTNIWISAINDLDGIPEKVIVVINDISEQKQLEGKLRISEELFSRAYQLSPALFTISTAKDGKHIEVNDAWSSVTGYSREEAMQKNVLQLGIWAKQEQREQFIHEINTHGFVRNFEMVLRTKQGTEKNMLYSGDAIDYRGEDCLLVVGTDITERAVEEQKKNEFIAVASHELRTPLTSLKGALDLINANVTGQIPESMQSMFKIASNNSSRLGRLIDDILDIEKLNAGKMEFSIQPVSIQDLINRVMSEHAGYEIRHGVSFVIDGRIPNASVLADEERLMQVFSNLMSNAAKFSPKGSEVRLSVCEKGKRVRISISDDGPGIPTEFHDKIFEKFTQAENVGSPNQPGTGLGLSIAKAIVERHGGELRFKTYINAGTTFYFELPKTTRKYPPNKLP